MIARLFPNVDELAINPHGTNDLALPAISVDLSGLVLRRLTVKNSAGRPAGSITAAQFLQRFVREGTPWAHIDIAGVALPPGATTLAPKGATGWGVMTLDRMIRDGFEAGADTPSKG